MSEKLGPEEPAVGPIRTMQEVRAELARSDPRRVEEQEQRVKEAEAQLEKAKARHPELDPKVFATPEECANRP